jgi:predicted DNA binding CopG/RHH family protein
MVNINIDLPEDIHRKAKSKASLKGMHLKDYIIEIVRKENGDI